jgi:hypothetical protein
MVRAMATIAQADPAAVESAPKPHSLPTLMLGAKAR